MKKTNIKNVLSIIKDVLSWGVIIFALSITVFIIVLNTTSNNNGYDIFGYRFYISRTDSMSKTDFSAGDVVICREVDVSTLKEGDVISFISKSVKNYGQTVTHKIRRITQDVNGDRAFVTYGTTTDVDDDALATEILGKYVGRIKGVGKALVFLKTPTGYFSLIFTPFAILIAFQCVNCVKLLKDKD